MEEVRRRRRAAYLRRIYARIQRKGKDSSNDSDSDKSENSPVFRKGRRQKGQISTKRKRRLSSSSSHSSDSTEGPSSNTSEGTSLKRMGRREKSPNPEKKNRSSTSASSFISVRHGSKVVFCARGEAAGKALEAEVNAKGPGESMYIRCDVTKEEDIKNVVNKTVEKYGRIDCLINNAGWHPPHSTIDNFSADDFRHLLDTNLVSYFLFAKYALPHLRKTEGNIINDSSLVAQIGQPGAVTYISTKGGITSFTKALAIDESEHNVRVNSFSPGNVWTPMWEQEVKNSANPELAKSAGEDAQLCGRFGTIEEAGLLCMFLAADATFCTGIDINLSGGAELNYGNKNRRTQKKIVSW